MCLSPFPYTYFVCLCQSPDTYKTRCVNTLDRQVMMVDSDNALYCAVGTVLDEQKLVGQRPKSLSTSYSVPSTSCLLRAPLHVRCRRH